MHKYEFEQFIMELKGVSGELRMLSASLERESEDIYADAARGRWRHLSRIIADMIGELEAWK